MVKNDAAPSAPTVFVGMSGGVDSSVAAALLVEQGYHVVGVYMKNWSRDLPGMKCPWAEDLADAKRVAVRLGIDFEVWDFEEAYREKVVDYMLAEFRAGRTPNPDVMCNQEIKFKLFYERARAAGADFIATGHYARVADGKDAESPTLEPGRPPVFTGAGLSRSQLGCGEHALESGNSASFGQPLLLRAIDENKDQTYFLYRISDEALKHTLFPIGEMKKPEVKALAAKMGLHNAYKKESMGVCFVGEVGMKDFLKEYIEARPGEIREQGSEKVLGYHEGAVFYTLGQRHGLYLSGVAGEANDGMPYYVVSKDLWHNIVYVSKNLNDEHLWTDTLRLESVIMRTGVADNASPENTGVQDGHSSERDGYSPDSSACSPQPSWLRLRPAPVKTGGRPGARVDEYPSLAVQVRLRHRAPLIPATFDGEKLHFKEPVKRPAAGQSAVLYDGEICLGGGIIAED